MRYRLRTLLIVVTLLCVVTARVTLLKRRADFHQRETARLISRIATTEREREQKIENAIHRLAQIGPAARELVISENGASATVSRIEWDNNLNDWQMATSHQIIANRYERAIYRPWVFVSDDPMRRH